MILSPGIIASHASVSSGALFTWSFSEQSGSYTKNTANPGTTNNSLSSGERVFQIVFYWTITAGSITATDSFVAGPNNSNVNASRLQSGAGTAAIRGGTSGNGSSLSLPTGNNTLSAWMKLNTGTSVTINPQMVGPGGTGTWAVTNSWQRFTYTVNSGVPVTALQFFIPANTDLLVYGVQIGPGTSASAYIPPSLDLQFGSGGAGGADFPTWSGNGTITATNAQRAVAVSDADTTLTTCTAYVAVKSSTTTPQQYGHALLCPNASGLGVPARLELQTSFWNAPANNPLPDGGSRSYNSFVGFGGLSKEFPAGNLYDQHWHICCVTGDGSDVHLYIDGILIDSPHASPVSGNPVSVPGNVFMLGEPSASAVGFPGQYAHVSVYPNVVHTYSQIKHNTSTIASQMKQSGLTLTGLQDTLLVCEGDSITDGIGSGSAGHAALLGAHYGITWVNYGHSGDQISQLNSRASQLDALYDPTKKHNILVLLIGRNDLDHTTWQTYVVNLQAYWQARKSIGWTVIGATLLPSTGATFMAQQPGANTWIRNNWSLYIDGMADIGGDGTIIANVANNAYFYDGTHPTAATYAIMAPYLETAIDSLNLIPQIKQIQ